MMTDRIVPKIWAMKKARRQRNKRSFVCALMVPKRHRPNVVTTDSPILTHCREVVGFPDFEGGLRQIS